MNFPRELKKTRQRLAVWSALEGADRPMSVMDIAAAITSENGGTALSTVYRVLEAFIAAGAVEKSQPCEGPALYEPTPHEHLHYAVCTVCHKRIPVAGCPVDSADLSTEGFEVTSHRLEMYGFCGQCKMIKK